MKNLYKFSVLGVALGLASTLLIGCGGGSSSNGSRVNRADIVFSDAIVTTEASNTNADTRNINVRGNSDGNEEGVHTGYTESEFHIYVVDESNNNFRGFQFFSDYEGSVPDAQVGGQIDFGLTDVEFYFYDEDEDAFWVAISGTATIVSKEGNKVVIDLDDVVFVPESSGAIGNFEIDGTIAYDERDMVDETGDFNLDKAHKAAATAKSKAKSSSASKTKKPFKW
jgi:hypothetical protein